MDALENGHDSRAAVNLHNNEAGRFVSIVVFCYLSTFSSTNLFIAACGCLWLMRHFLYSRLSKQLSKGPVSVMVCLEAAVFRRVGRSWLISEKSVPIWKSNTIKQRSWRWTKLGWGLVTADNRGAITDTFSTVSGTELIYMEDSPDYCAKNLSLGQHGTEGRECLQSGKNLSQWEKRSCKRLCHECGLKVEERRIETVSSCNCKFHWCCTVKCETCTQIVTKYVCAKRHKNRRPHNNSRRRQHARNRWTHLCNILICIFPMLIYEILRYAVFSLTVYYSAFQPLY